MLDQAKAARATGPVQSVAPMPLPFTSVRDLDHPHQLRHDQTLAKQQPSPLEAERRKRAKTPPQPDPHDALDAGCAQTTERESRDRGHSRVRDKGRQKELDRVRACAANVANAARVGGEARVAGAGARAGGDPRAMGTMRVRHKAGMR